MVGIYMKHGSKLRLQSLILILLTFAMLGTFLASMISSVKESKENLERSLLNENQFYAKKLANLTDELFKNMQQTLQTSAKDLTSIHTNVDATYLEISDALQSTNFFNSVFYVNEKGIVVRSAPQFGLEGVEIKSVGVKEALSKKAPTISEPYVGVSKQIIILVSHPVFDEKGVYKGFIGGTIYLDAQNSIQSILALHPQHRSGSYVYVVDPRGNIIYHPDKDRIGDNVIQNPIVARVTHGQEGLSEVENTEGISMLAGYAYAGTPNWGVVSQTPKEAVKEPTFMMVKEVGITALSIIIFVFIVSLLLLKRIANPLQRLAEFAHDVADKQPHVEKPNIPDRYLELNELKKTMYLMVDYYKEQIETFETEATVDALTGLYNRRHLNNTIKELQDYSVIMFDIDRFKLVNDQYGHLMGDEVLKLLAMTVRSITREQDLAFRFGGEEFVILLPLTDVDTAHKIAEQLRSTIEASKTPIGRKVTISIGIGNMPKNSIHYTELLDLTDQALYKAKNDGRNRIVRIDELN
ncbi:diguanylate cyclase [Bacillus sp. BGMRC 2118]|nr:diguanylate cyclase [Bacillus sp. BGMRC 2118]